MMTDTLTLAWALGAGVVLGAFFFGGLWWTVRKGAACQRPALLFLSSFLLRTSIALAGLYFVAGGHWERLLAGLLGFVIARFIVTKLTGPQVVPRTSPAKEAGHAS
jgi:F1F0 ATPase subunit 2